MRRTGRGVDTHVMDVGAVPSRPMDTAEPEPLPDGTEISEGSGGSETVAPADTTEADAGPTLSERIAASRAKVEERLSSTYQRLEDARPGSGPIDTAFRAFERDRAAGGGVLSAAVAFRIFLFLVPYVFFMVVGLGLASNAAESGPREVARTAGISGVLARTLVTSANLSFWDRVWVLCITGFALFLAARAAVKVLRITHGLIWRVRIPKARRRGISALCLVGLVTVVVADGGLVQWLRSKSVVLGIVGIVISTLVPFGIWLLAFRWLPHAECPWWALVPGAATLAIGMTLLQAGTVFWFTEEIQRKSDTYGAIGLSLALLLWAYMLGRIITASMSINAAFWYRDEERRGHAVPAPMDLEERLMGEPPEPSV